MYPEKIDTFVEKLNKNDTGYVIEDEMLTIVNGIFEGELDHDNIRNESVMVFTGPKMSGERIDNYYLSIPSNEPWKRIIRVFSNTPIVYVTYETLGDQVEAEDINQVQESIVNTQTEVERYKTVNDQVVSNLDVRLTTTENNKAEKTYADTELLKKADKATTYTKTETDDRIQGIIGAAPEALDTLEEIARALGEDPDFAATITNELSKKVDKVTGKQLSTEDYTATEKAKLAKIEAEANKYIHPSTHPASMIIESALQRFVSDAEKTAWYSKQDALSDDVASHYHSADRAWANITGKPSVFTPSAHNHDASYVKKTGDTITGGDLYVDGGSVNYIRPETTGGWARGFWWSMRDKSRIGGIGVLGSGDAVSKFYIGYGISPWSGSIIEAFPDYVNINGKLRTQQTEVGDVDNVVATKKYVDDKTAGAGTGDMLKSVYDIDSDGIVDKAKTVTGPVTWNQLKGVL